MGRGNIPDANATIANTSNSTNNGNSSTSLSTTPATSLVQSQQPHHLPQHQHQQLQPQQLGGGFAQGNQQVGANMVAITSTAPSTNTQPQTVIRKPYSHRQSPPVLQSSQPQSQSQPQPQPQPQLQPSNQNLQAALTPQQQLQKELLQMQQFQLQQQQLYQQQQALLYWNQVREQQQQQQPQAQPQLPQQQPLPQVQSQLQAQVPPQQQPQQPPQVQPNLQAQVQRQQPQAQSQQPPQASPLTPSPLQNNHLQQQNQKVSFVSTETLSTAAPTLARPNSDNYVTISRSAYNKLRLFAKNYYNQQTDNKTRPQNPKQPPGQLATQPQTLAPPQASSQQKQQQQPTIQATTSSHAPLSLLATSPASVSRNPASAYSQANSSIKPCHRTLFHQAQLEMKLTASPGLPNDFCDAARIHHLVEMGRNMYAFHAIIDMMASMYISSLDIMLEAMPELATQLKTPESPFTYAINSLQGAFGVPACGVYLKRIEFAEEQRNALLKGKFLPLSRYNTKYLHKIIDHSKATMVGDIGDSDINITAKFKRQKLEFYKKLDKCIRRVCFAFIHELRTAYSRLSVRQLQRLIAHAPFINVPNFAMQIELRDHFGPTNLINYTALAMIECSSVIKGVFLGIFHAPCLTGADVLRRVVIHEMLLVNEEYYSNSAREGEERSAGESNSTDSNNNNSSRSDSNSNNSSHTNNNNDVSNKSDFFDPFFSESLLGSSSDPASFDYNASANISMAMEMEANPNSDSTDVIANTITTTTTAITATYTDTDTANASVTATTTTTTTSDGAYDRDAPYQFTSKDSSVFEGMTKASADSIIIIDNIDTNADTTTTTVRPPIGTNTAITTITSSDDSAEEIDNRQPKQLEDDGGNSRSNNADSSDTNNGGNNDKFSYGNTTTAKQVAKKRPRTTNHDKRLRDQRPNKRGLERNHGDDNDDDDDDHNKSTSNQHNNNSESNSENDINGNNNNISNNNKIANNNNNSNKEKRKRS